MTGKYLKKSERDRILKKYKYLFDALKEYDITHTFPFQRKRIDITISYEALDKLKALSKKTGKPVSRIIEEAVKKNL